MNEYRPWKQEGISELKYFKKRYLEARQREELLLKIINTLIPFLKSVQKYEDLFDF